MIFEMECIVFKAADTYFAIEAQHTHRVLDDVRVTPVPLLPLCHLGLLYYRGELFDVIDIGTLLGREKGDQVNAGTKNYRVMLLKWSQRKLALMADEIVGLTWSGDSKGGKEAPSQEECNFELITPDHIWEMLSRLSYGYHKV
jgi:chemotaxis signal transduction protein